MNTDPIIVHFNTNDTEEGISLTPFEPVYTDPSCGQYEPGVLAFDGRNAREYFISEDGRVYDCDDNEHVGTATKLRDDYDRRERELDRLIREEPI